MGHFSQVVKIVFVKRRFATALGLVAIGGLIIALAPIIGPFVATAAVVGTLLVLMVIVGLIARARKAKEGKQP